MKNLFLGLTIAALAFGASAFTNAKSGRFASVYITGHTGGVYSYTINDPQNCQSDQPLPCEVLYGEYDIDLPEGTVTDADFNTYFSIVTTKDSY